MRRQGAMPDQMPRTLGSMTALQILVPVRLSFHDEPTINSHGELAVATSAPHNLRRRSNG